VRDSGGVLLAIMVLLVPWQVKFNAKIVYLLCDIGCKANSARTSSR